MCVVDAFKSLYKLLFQNEKLQFTFSVYLIYYFTVTTFPRLPFAHKTNVSLLHLALRWELFQSTSPAKIICLVTALHSGLLRLVSVLKWVALPRLKWAFSSELEQTSESRNPHTHAQMFSGKLRMSTQNLLLQNINIYVFLKDLSTWNGQIWQHVLMRQKQNNRPKTKSLIAFY